MAEKTIGGGYYDIVKNCKGSLVLNLPAFDSSTIDRRVVINHNVKQVRVPAKYALGIFVNGTLERMYRNGVFSIEPAAEFEKDVAAVFYPVTDKKPIISDADLKNYLIRGNRAKIKELIAENPVARDSIIVLARENIGDIPTSMVKDLEKMLEVELTVENEQE